MKRRALALAGAAVLTVGFTGLAGPAAADPGIDAQVGTVIISQVGVELDGTGATSTEGGYILLRNTTSSNVNVGGFEVRACSTTADFDVRTFPQNTTILANSTLLIADASYAGSRLADFPFETSDTLEQAGGGVELRDAVGSLQGNVKWESPDSVCGAFEPANVSPSNVESMHYNTIQEIWFLDDPL